MTRMRTLPLLLATVLALGACATNGKDMLSADAPRAWDLRCLIRERLVDYLVRNHPGALPRIRDEVIGAGADAG